MPISFDGRFTVNKAFINGYGLQAGGVDSTAFNYPAGVFGRLDLMRDPFGSSDIVCRHRVVQGDPLSALGRRAEYYHQPSSAPGTTLWYWWSDYFAEDWKFDRRFAVFQQHDTPDGLDAARPPTILGVFEPSGQLAWYNTSDVNATTSPAITSFGRTMFSRMPLLGRWNTWVKKVTWSATAGVGSIDLWLNRRRIIVERTQINTFNDTVGPHIKQGIYDYFGTSDFGSRESYSKGIVVGSGYTTFNEFMAAMSSSDTELEMVGAGRMG